MNDPQNMPISYADLSEEIPENQRPLLDRNLSPAEEGALSPEQSSWRESGVVILDKFLPEALIQAYCDLRARLKKPSGWSVPCPYMVYPQIRDICLYAPLMAVMKRLIGDDMGLHLNLTGWVSTERNYHCDDYLNPEFIASHYTAVWMALDDISPDSGPFEYVPGSHRWPFLRREKVLGVFNPSMASDPNWPKKTEPIVVQAVNEEIRRRGAETRKFLGKRGDVLIWHGRLIHRGSEPLTPGKERKALIAHYSALSKRTDMPERRLHEDAEKNVRGFYFHIPTVLKDDEKV